MARPFLFPVQLPGDAATALHAVPKQQLDTGLATKAASGHNHDGTYQPAAPAPQTLSSSATLTMTGGTGSHFRCAALTTNTTVAVPTGATDGQRFILEVVASGATRTVSLNASIVNMSGATYPVSLAATKRLTLGILYSGTTAYLLASAVQP